ncbi:Rha family transcriptional regulator [Marinobacter psychrophilus]|jgi:phage regulator Rha-like protein|uniref:Rha family transcriptional regulator n=1 Tax=Marinobacter psychrophilus TaxID=330734 RepID=UPI001B609E6B|nr:Rha family transcriptional regulator [Marinobacter psychrophilus]MBQ0762973.1 Rha family transcriptional regulator [Marinobacter psychrophilus]MBQ0846089.1 Rha family transcriptional regulator [Marinobacter psychrophilus]
MNSTLTTAHSINEQTMSSREIAEITEKRHDHVIRDIRNIFDQLEIEPTQFWGGYRDAKGETRGCFNLNRFYTELLITGYDVRRRAAVIDRWMLLEEQVAHPRFRRRTPKPYVQPYIPKSS